MRVSSPLTSMLYFQMVIMAGTVMLAYYFEYTDTFAVNVQGFFCYEGAYRKPYPGPEDRSAVPPVLLYSLTAGVPVLVVRQLVGLGWAGLGWTGADRPGPRAERRRRRGCSVLPARRGCSPAPRAPGGQRCRARPRPRPLPNARRRSLFLAAIYVTASACIASPDRLLLVKITFGFAEGVSVAGRWAT